MNAEAVIYLLLYNLHDCTFNVQVISSSLSYDLAFIKQYSFRNI